MVIVNEDIVLGISKMGNMAEWLVCQICNSKIAVMGCVENHSSP